MNEERRQLYSIFCCNYIHQDPFFHYVKRYERVVVLRANKVARRGGQLRRRGRRWQLRWWKCRGVDRWPMKNMQTISTSAAITLVVVPPTAQPSPQSTDGRLRMQSVLEAGSHPRGQSNRQRGRTIHGVDSARDVLHKSPARRSLSSPADCFTPAA